GDRHVARHVRGHTSRPDDGRCARAPRRGGVRLRVEGGPGAHDRRRGRAGAREGTGAAEGAGAARSAPEEAEGARRQRVRPASASAAPCNGAPLAVFIRAMAAGAAALEFRLLGPVEVVGNGGTIAVGGPRQRALLALLLLEVGRPVSADRLAQELWPGRPSAGVSTLASYVSRLRAALGDGVSISGVAAGYALEVSPDQVHRARFERLVREGREALARGAAQRAAERLRSALALWRGRPFGELGSEVLRLEAD